MFHLGSQDGLLTHFLNGPLDAFLTWYEEAFAEFPEDFKPESVPILQRIVWQGRTGLEAMDAQHPEVVDDLLKWYYEGSFYLNNAQAQLRMMQASDTLLSYRRFQNLEETFEQIGRHDARHLLAYLATGRPILGGAVRAARLTWEDYSRLAYWTAPEAQYLWEFFEAFSPDERLLLDPERAALPAVYEAVSTAVKQRTGLIIQAG